MNNLGVWLLRLMVFFLGSCYPALGAAALQATAAETGRDPAYEIYRDYRYTYDTYVYLFLDETTGAGPGEAGITGAGGWGTELAGAGSAGAEGAGLVAGSSGPGSAGPGAGGSGVGSAGPGAGGSGPGADADGSGPGAAEPAAGNAAVPGLAQLRDYDFLMKNFYSVHPSTTAGRDLMKAEDLLGMDLTLEKDPSVPQILIYHTHSQETYADWSPENPDASVVGIGNYLTELLTARGWNVIHDTSAYDIQGGELDRSRAYNYALEGISKILREHPSVQVILDIHRDGVRDDLHLASTVAGKPTANIMFFQGMSQTPEGPIDYLPNPYLRENLAFSLKMQLLAAQQYPGYTRKIYLKGFRYNLHLRPRSSLIEVGAQTNTGEEAKNAMEPLAELLDRVLQAR